MSLTNAESHIIARAPRLPFRPVLHWLSGTVRGASGLSSWIISAGVHLALALLFAGIVAQSQLAVPGFFIDSAFTEPGPGLQPLESVEFQPLVADESGAPSAHPHQPEIALAAAETEPLALAAVGSGLPVGIGMDDAESKGEGEGGDGNGNGAGEPRGIGFFGTYTEGKSVV